MCLVLMGGGVPRLRGRVKQSTRLRGRVTMTLRVRERVRWRTHNAQSARIYVFVRAYVRLRLKLMC